MLKTYETFDSISAIEQVICEEVIKSGSSQGWDGSMDNFLLLQESLSRKGIQYCYMGTWKKTLH